MVAMADDWRLTVDFDEEADGAQLLERLDAREFAAEERRRLGDRVVVSRDGARVFFYADSEATAREVEAVVRAELESRGKAVAVALEHWHPVEEEWMEPSIPLPRTEAEIAAARGRREAREAAESAAAGHAEWEVRIELPGRDETVALAERLEAEGIPVVRRAAFLLVGAATEDDASALAERLRAEAPAGSKVDVQPGGEMVWEVAPQNPFTFLGGLGG
jgi:hypothetical protein